MTFCTRTSATGSVPQGPGGRPVAGGRQGIRAPVAVPPGRAWRGGGGLVSAAKLVTVNSTGVSRQRITLI